MMNLADHAVMSVLLIDDDPHTRMIFKLVMAHHHLKLTALADAESAIDYLRDNDPDVIVMDLFLPGMDGYKALDRIRQMKRGRKAKIVATTAFYSSDTQQAIVGRGFDGYLPKPFETKNIVTYLQSIVAEG